MCVYPMDDELDVPVGAGCITDLPDASVRPTDACATDVCEKLRGQARRRHRHERGVRGPDGAQQRRERRGVRQHRGQARRGNLGVDLGDVLHADSEKVIILR